LFRYFRPFHPLFSPDYKIFLAAMMNPAARSRLTRRQAMVANIEADGAHRSSPGDIFELENADMKFFAGLQGSV
jgi:hypothetical protein